MTKDEMVGWYRQLNRHEFEQTAGDSEGQGSLACCSSQSRKESETTQRLKDNKMRNYLRDYWKITMALCKLLKKQKKTYRFHL